jgi:hypothetical protein
MESVTALFNIDPDSLKDKNFQYLIHWTMENLYCY